MLTFGKKKSISLVWANSVGFWEIKKYVPVVNSSLVEAVHAVAINRSLFFSDAGHTVSEWYLVCVNLSGIPLNSPPPPYRVSSR